MMRLVVAVVVLALCVGFAQASTLDLVLDSPSPAGTVVLSGSALPSPYQTGVNVYAGVMNWTDQHNSATHYTTYCIDVASVVYVGNVYHFNLVDLATLSLYNPTVDNAMENLFAQHPVESNVGTALGVGITAGNAATFQTALWDISQNFDTTGNRIATPNLNFSSPSTGFTPSDLTTAATWADNAYSAGPYTGPHNFAALVATDGGQSQAMFLVGIGPQITPSPVPTPTSFATGAALFATLFFIRRSTRRAR